MKDTPKIGQWVNRGISEQKNRKIGAGIQYKFPLGL